ncbi:MAG TPA: DUF2235 domain-containing protein [Candidatus Sulfotelmatobacter sp.]|nr:DUF2235 domain-containing protein [Candidatus Sulfotelmatobacter sp.]
MPKKIVVCCDGTGNQFGDQNSNVVKLYKCLIRSTEQVAYYHPGVGTMGSQNALSLLGKAWTLLIGLAFGYGISDNIADAYQFLMHNYEPDDQVFIFGFSRGAYTARALCGMLHVVGLLTPGNEGLIPYAIRLIKRKHIDFKVAFDFKRTFSRDCAAYFIGVWDTVASVGWVYNPVNFPYTRVTKNPDFHIVRHAVSVDERRAFFRDNPVGAPNSPQQNVVEAWFAGVHSDVGGSYPEEASQLSKIALKWMLGEAEAAGLLVDQKKKAAILGGSPPWVAPDPTTKNQHESLHGAWWIAELWPKLAGVMNAAGQWRQRIRVNLARRRTIPDGALFHESVQQRLDATNIRYRPSNLPADIQAAKFKIPPGNLVKDASPKASAAAPAAK